jgi:hypothetical protein
MAKKADRFEVVYKDGSELSSGGVRQILVDNETGANYLLRIFGYSGGMTPLLDSEGKVIIMLPGIKKTHKAKELSNSACVSFLI